MKEAKPTDSYNVLKESSYSFEDDAYLLDFYAPILSLKAIGVYLALRNEAGEESKPFSSFYLHYQISEGDFFSSLEGLEAIGLIKTYFLEKSESNSFSFALYSPRSPEEFLSNELLSGTLIRFTNEEYVLSLQKKYALSPLPEGYQDVSKKFMDQFQLDMSGKLYLSLSSKNSLAGKRCPAISLYFDKRKFLNRMKEERPSFQENILAKTEYVRIARYASLYAFDEETMASFLLSSRNVFDMNKEYGSRVDFHALEKLCMDNDAHEYLRRKAGKASEIHGESGVATVIRAMDSMNSVDFLTLLQKGGKPAQNDLKLINTLVVEMGLPENVTNALIFHVLKINDNALVSSYVEGLAATLVRQGVETALDALNYLERNVKKSRNPQTTTSDKPTFKKQSSSLPKKTLPPKQPLPPKEEKPASEEDEDYDAILDNL